MSAQGCNNELTWFLLGVILRGELSAVSDCSAGAEELRLLISWGIQSRKLRMHIVTREYV
jgi:hypothetical protein